MLLKWNVIHQLNAMLNKKFLPKFKFHIVNILKYSTMSSSMVIIILNNL